MKRVIAIFLILLLLAGMSSCGKPEKDETVLQAIQALKAAWEQDYATSATHSDGYFEIKNTRVIYIKDNSVAHFEDVACIVEFELYTDYYGSAPYYVNVGRLDSVTVYKDGTMEVNPMNPILVYSRATYTTDFSDFIGAITDYGTQYNQTAKLK
jgi:hypothetical protein